MRTGYIIGGFAGAAVLVAAAGLGMALSPGWALDALASASQQQFGRPLTAQSVHLELSPSFGLRFDDLRMAGASPDDAPLLTAASLRLPLGVGALLAHSADLSNTTLVEPRISLAINEMGHVNWPAIAPGNQRHVFISNGSLTFSDARTGQRFTVERIQATAEASDTGEVSAKGSAAANAALVNFDAYVKDVARVASGGSPAELSLAAPAFNVTFNGRLAIAGALSLAGTVAVEGPDARQALAWTGAPIPGDKGLKAFVLSGGLDTSGRAFAVHGATLQIDDIAARGEISLDYRNATPDIAAVLKTSAIDLAHYLPAAGFSGPDWNTAPFDLAGLRNLDATLHLEPADLTAGPLKLGPAVIETKLAGGVLDASVASATLPGFKLKLDGSGGTQALAVTLHSVDPAGLLGAVGNLDWLSGAGKLAFDLQATGATLQEMVSTLHGTAQLDMTGGSIAHFDLAHALAAISRDIQQGWPSHAASRSDFSALSASFNIADGIATMKPFDFRGPGVTMTATGDIDLLRRAVDLRADPRLVTGSNGETVGLPVAVVINGPWSKPKLYPDMANILTNPGAAYADLKGLGLPQFPAAGGGN